MNDGSSVSNNLVLSVVNELSQILGVKRDVLEPYLVSFDRGLVFVDSEVCEAITAFCSYLRKVHGDDFPDIVLNEATPRDLARVLWSMTQEIDARDGLLERAMPVSHYRDNGCVLHTKRLMAVVNVFFRLYDEIHQSSSTVEEEQVSQQYLEHIAPLIAAPLSTFSTRGRLTILLWTSQVGSPICSELEQFLQSRWRPEDNLPSEKEARTQARQAIRRAGVPKAQERLFLPFVLDLIRRQPKGMTQQTKIEQMIAEIHQGGGFPASWTPQEGVSA